MALLAINKAELASLIGKEIENAIKEETETAIEQAKLRLERRIPEIVSGLAIRLFHTTQLEYNRDNIVITIKQDKPL